MVSHSEIEKTVQYTQHLISTTIDGEELFEYIGEARPGATVGAPYWRIKKLSYDSNLNVSSVMWASSNAGFNKRMSSVTSYNYG